METTVVCVSCLFWEHLVLKAIGKESAAFWISHPRLRKLPRCPNAAKATISIVLAAGEILRPFSALAELAQSAWQEARGQAVDVPAMFQAIR